MELTEKPLKKHEVDLTNGKKLLWNLLKVSLPICLSGMLQVFYNCADLIVCRFFGSGFSTAAISSTSALTNLIINLFLGLSIGANVMVATYYGEKEPGKAQKIVNTSMLLSIITGFAVGIIGFFFSRLILEWMGTTSDVINLSATYLKIYFIGAPFNLIYNFGAALLRGVGDTKRPLIILTISGIFNVILNIIFVYGLKYDVAGVAIATTVSQIISATAVLFLLKKGVSFFTFSIKSLRIDKASLLNILKIGIPSSIQSSIFCLSNVFLQSSVNSLGTYVVDGNGASSMVEGFGYQISMGFNSACASFVAANYGAKNKPNIRKSMLYAILLTLVSNIIVAIPTLIFSHQLLGLFVKYEESIEFGTERLIIYMLTYFLCCWCDIFSSGMKGMGKPILPVVLTLIAIFITRAIWIFVFFNMPQFHSLGGVMLCYPISWICSCIVNGTFFLVRYKKVHFILDKSLI